MNRAVVGLGSNIDPERHIPLALEALRASCRVVSTSRVVDTEPVGPPGQPPFRNGAVLVETERTRDELCRWLRELETRLGRVRTDDRYAPRTIDLDLLMWNGEVTDPDVHEREYLRQALEELAADREKGQP